MIIIIVIVIIIIIIIIVVIIIVIIIMCRQHTDSARQASGGVFTLQHTPANHASRCAQVHVSHRGCSGERTTR